MYRERMRGRQHGGGLPCKTYFYRVGELGFFLLFTMVITANKTKAQFSPLDSGDLPFFCLASITRSVL